MTYELTLEETTWELCPSSGTEEVLQNVRCLLLTTKGTVWMYRGFGLSCELVDRPINVVQHKFLSEVVKAVQRYEPRAKVKSVRWQQSQAQEGILRPIITLEVLT